MMRLLLILIVAITGAPLAMAAWSLPDGDRPLRIHVQRGLWSREYQIEAAVERLGGAILTESWDSMGTGFGWLGHANQGKGSVHFFPSAAELAQCHLLIICNTNARNLGGHQQQIADYVRNGGAVLFLGGRFGLGKAQQESPMAAITPADFAGQGRLRETDLQPVPEGLPLQPGAGHFGELAWAAGPRLYWYHQMTPKAEAKIWLSAGEQPLLAVGEYGQGRSALFAGTVLGEPPDGELAFWRWDAWPELLAETMRWLVEAPAAASHSLPDELRQSLTAMADTLADPLAERAETDTAKLHQQLTQAAWLAQDEASLTALISIVQQVPGDIPPAVAHVVGRVHFSLITPAMAASATRLFESGQAGKTALGIYLLGAGRDAQAEQVLGDFYRLGKPRAAKAGAAGGVLDLDPRGGGSGMAMQEPMAARRDAQSIRMAVLTSLGHLGRPEALALLNQLTDVRQGRLDTNAFAELLTDEHRLYQQWLLARLRCGEVSVATELVAQLLEIQYVIARARTEKNKTDDRLEAAHAQIPINLQWQRELFRQLAYLPPSSREAMLTILDTTPAPRQTPIRLALLPTPRR